MIPKYQLQDLCSEAAKLKTLGAMESVPPDRLVRLLNILEKNIRDGTRVSPIADPVSVLAWGVIPCGLVIKSVEVKCRENAAFLMPMCESGRAAQLSYSVE
jgi:cohesin loading factor subunit SCC2